MLYAVQLGLMVLFTNLEALSFSIRMIHPDTELRFISPEIGFGVFATKLIPQGTITWPSIRSTK